MARMLRTWADMEEIRRLEERLRVAALENDCGELDRLLRNEFTSKTGGKLTYKRDLIRAHSVGTLRLHRAEVVGAVEVLPLGFTMQTWSRANIDVTDDWCTRRGVFRHHRVWVRGETGWQAMRATIEPEPS